MAQLQAADIPLRPRLAMAELPEIGLLQRAWRRFRRHRMACLSALILALILAYVTLGALILDESYANQTNLTRGLQAPSWAHPFGTDRTGRDVLARTIYGGQISLLVGILSVMVSVGIGTAIGALAGFYGRWMDSLLMRFTEAMLNIPQLFLLIVLSKLLSSELRSLTILGRTFDGSMVIVIGIIGVTSWMYEARLVRANFLSLKEQEFVTAARATGVKNYRIILRHILPNTMAPILVSATLGVANAILTEAYASFLGLGVQPPTASWGSMLEDALPYLETAPWLWLFPGSLILLTVISINFLGDGLRDALDPRTMDRKGGG
ncbi:MAG: ABC transporter permease [Anaerolineae bacterium]|nr:ABC transporter permease [Anaerolineae bacterium]MDW8099291.1 ABC transporter permease [Anaerolineae bacterium]